MSNVLWISTFAPGGGNPLWLSSFTSGGGEVNTASNVGTGVGAFKQKVLADLQFNSFKSENNLLTVALDGITNDIEFTVNESLINHLNIDNIGTNSHSAIDSHIADLTIHFTKDSITQRIDGGFANSVYLPAQSIDGGGA